MLSVRICRLCCNDPFRTFFPRKWINLDTWQTDGGWEKIHPIEFLEESSTTTQDLQCCKLVFFVRYSTPFWPLPSQIFTKLAQTCRLKLGLCKLVISMPNFDIFPLRGHLLQNSKIWCLMQEPLPRSRPQTSRFPPRQISGYAYGFRDREQYIPIQRKGWKTLQCTMHRLFQ